VDQSVVGPVDPVLVPAEGDEFPFPVEASLSEVIAFWEAAAAGPDPVRRAQARAVLDALAGAPALRRPLAGPEVLARHRPVVDALLSCVFPAAGWEREVAALLVPFRLQSLYATPAFQRLLTDGQGRLRARMDLDARGGLALRLQHAYAAVLEKFYGVDATPDTPLIITARDPDTGLDRHFKTVFDPTFVTVEAPGGAPRLTEEDRQRLRASRWDPGALMAVLPPERFRFRGITVFRALEVTDQEILSSIERDLIDRESVISTAAFRRLEDKLRALFRLPSLSFGLAAMNGDQVLLLNSNRRIEHGCIFADSAHFRKSDFAGSIYERAAAQGEPLVIEDLAAWPQRGPMEEHLLCEGVRSLVLAPLHYQDALIGMLELESPAAGELHAGQAMRLRQVLPLFSMAVKRSLDELDARVEAVIKAHCTAIHPSVEWRFRRAAMRMLDAAGDDGAPPDLEPIVFEGAHSLYAQSDIRGSSVERNLAIQADLTAHLGLALEAVRAAHRERDLPVLDELAYRITRHLERIERGIASGDELGVVAFLRQHVEPVLAHLEGLPGSARERVAAYRAALDPRLGTLYRRRRALDESIMLINEALGAHLDGEERRAQAMAPHYFEMQKSDGVEWTIYAGPSLVESGAFDPLYLRNLRLWQLLVVCGLARRSEALRRRLPVPLETTHLVLAQHAPLAIRFRMDEKRFDVDGAYNIRYQVIKRRIDKATVRGTGERLTRPGHVAIAYTQRPEAAEYREYLDYLASRGAVQGAVEDVELEPLQGVEGLRALRVAVNLDGPGPEAEVPPPGLERAAERTV
jgi:hypothetical protein